MKDKLQKLLDDYKLSGYADLIMAAAVGCISFKREDNECGSKFGGLPDVPDGFQWPLHNDRPINFIGQLYLPQLTAAMPENKLLPQTGFLYFFFEFDESIAGYEIGDFPYWKVLYFDCAKDAVKKYDKTVECEVLPDMPLDCRQSCSIPSWEDLPNYGIEMDNWDDTKKYLSLYEELLKICNGLEEHHQVLGYPNLIQGPINETVAELHEELFKEKTNPQDWLILLQVDSCGYLMWEDYGKIYWFINKSDLLKKDFSKVWLHLQCT